MRVAPGEVIGVDLDSGSLQRARALAGARGIGNIRFEQADVYDLPFPDARFDAVFSHALTSHLGDPARGLAEMRRVLKPGGVAAVVENDIGACLVSPPGSSMDRFIELFRQIQWQIGGNRLQPRNFRAALLGTGFVRVELHGGCEGYGTPDQSRTLAVGMAAIARSLTFVGTALAQGWATQGELDALPAGLLAWGERPDAFVGLLKCGGLGWASDPAPIT
jgi:SAM-dependent methyltransferase